MKVRKDGYKYIILSAAFFAVAQDSTFMTSQDGKTWSRLENIVNMTELRSSV